MLNINHKRRRNPLKVFLTIIPAVILVAAGISYYLTTRYLIPLAEPEAITLVEDDVAPPEPEPIRLPDNAVIAGDDFSNVQPDACQKPVFDRHTLAERKANGLPTELPPITPYTKEKVAYLTFDDGPDAVNTPAILDILANYGVKATFFVTGTMCENNPDVLKRIFNEGHAIGNHSYSHDYNKLYASADSFLAEITKTDEVIHSIIGVRPLNIRAPGGTIGMFTDDFWPMLKANGYVEHDWNVSTEDATAEHPSADRELEHVANQTANGVKDGAAIVLMHSTAGKENTVAALPSIIMLLQERGYTFGVVTPMTPQPW